LFAAVKKRERGASDFLMRASIVGLDGWARQRFAVPMQLMAGKARDRGLIGELGVEQAPRSLLIQRRDQIADATLEMHGVAAKAVVHQQRLGVVVFAQEDLRVGCAVGTGGPACVFFAMALGAALFDSENVVGLQPNLLGNSSLNMCSQLANVFQMKTGVKRHHVAVAFRARDIAVRRFVPVAVGLPDLVALGAGFSSGVAVIEARAGQKEYREQEDEQRRDHPQTEELAIDGHLLRGSEKFPVLAQRTREKWGTLGCAAHALPHLHQVGGCVVGNCHNRQHRVEPAVVDMNTSVDHIHVVDVVNSAVPVHH